MEKLSQMPAELKCFKWWNFASETYLHKGCLVYHVTCPFHELKLLVKWNFLMQGEGKHKHITEISGWTDTQFIKTIWEL